MGLPELIFEYGAAARTVASRTKRGIVALIVQDESFTPGVYPVIHEADIPSELSAENKAAVQRALMGSINAPGKVLVTVQTAESEPVDALPMLVGMDYDYIAFPAGADESKAQAMADKVKELRKGNYIGKAVVPNYAADDVGVINFVTGDIKVGEETFTAADYCGRIAGMVAGAPLEGSITAAPLDEVTSVTEEEDPDAAIEEGKLILYNDGRKIRVGRGVNSKKTLTSTEPAILKKIKAVEAIDLIHYYAISVAEDNYRGRCANNFDNKMLLVGALRQYMKELEGQGILDEGSSGADIDLEATKAYLREHNVSMEGMDDEEIRRQPTGSLVLIQLTGYLLDAMEDFRIGLALTNT